jgi:hypothetical protein
MELTVADFGRSYTGPIPLLTGATADTTSGPLTPGWRGTKLTVNFEVPTATASIDLLLLGTPNVLLKTWNNVGDPQDLWAGNLEHIDMQGAAFLIRAYNITSGSVSVSGVGTY